MTCYFCFLALRILSLFSLVDFITIQEQRLPRKETKLLVQTGVCSLMQTLFPAPKSHAAQKLNTQPHILIACDKLGEQVLFYIRLIVPAVFCCSIVQKSTYNMLILCASRWCVNLFCCFHQNSNPLQFDLFTEHLSNFRRSHLFFPQNMQLRAWFLFPSC